MSTESSKTPTKQAAPRSLVFRILTEPMLYCGIGLGFLSIGASPSAVVGAVLFLITAAFRILARGVPRTSGSE